MKTKKIINFIGNSCVGKTTISKMLFEKYSHSFHLAFDQLKWQLSGYNRNSHRELIGNIEKNIIPVLLQEKDISFIISDFRFKDEEDFQNFLEYLNISENNFINIFLEAPLDVRLERYKERLDRCKKLGYKLSITNKDMFLAQAKEKFYVPKGSVQFHTDKLSKEEILRIISKMID